MGIRGKTIPAEGKGPEVGLCLDHLRNSKEAGVEGDRPGKVSQVRGWVR